MENFITGFIMATISVLIGWLMGWKYGEEKNTSLNEEKYLDGYIDGYIDGYQRREPATNKVKILYEPELVIPLKRLKGTDMDKIKIHKGICENMHEVYKAKNADYGDSFAKTRQSVNNAILVRLSDKFYRLETLLKGNEQKVKDESIEDNLLDLANYCIMELVERRAEKTKEPDRKSDIFNPYNIEIDPDFIRLTSPDGETVTFTNHNGNVGVEVSDGKKDPHDAKYKAEHFFEGEK